MSQVHIVIIEDFSVTHLEFGKAFDDQVSRTMQLLNRR